MAKKYEVKPECAYGVAEKKVAPKKKAASKKKEE